MLVVITRGRLFRQAWGLRKGGLLLGEGRKGGKEREEASETG